MIGRAAVLLALALPAAACGETKTNAWLVALQQEPLARLVPSHGKVELDLETTTGREIFGKEDSAIVSRAFSYPTRAAASRARRIAFRVATGSGWRISVDRRFSTGPFRGSKRLPPGQATLWIGAYEKGNRYHLTIRLEPAG